jgi:hypothetical protein
VKHRGSRSARAPLRLLASLPVTIGLELAAAAVVAAALVAGRVQGIPAAASRLLESWGTLFGPVPVPGLKTVAALAAVHLLAAFVVRGGLRSGRRRAGLLVARTGLLALCLLALAPGPQRTLTVLRPGAAVSMSFDPVAWDLVLEPAGSAVALRLLREGAAFPGIPAIVVDRRYANARPLVGPAGDELSGLAPQHPQPDPAANRPGVVLRVVDAGGVRRIYVWPGRPALVAGVGGGMTARLARRELPLPVTLTLRELDIDTYPQAEMPRRVTARILVAGPGEAREARLRSGSALRTAGQRLTIRSTAADEGGAPMLVLDVSRYPLRIPLLAAAFLVVLGLALEAGLRPAAGLAILVLALVPQARALARDGLPYAELGRLPVLSDGRLMPLETYAELALQDLGGARSAGGEAPISWMARVLFAPENALSDRVFLVGRRETLQRLGLRAAPGRLSYAQLEPAAARLQDLAGRLGQRRDLSDAEREIVALKRKVLLFTRLVASADYLRPHPDFTVAAPLAPVLGLAPGQYSLREIAAVRDRLGGPWEGAGQQAGARRLTAALARWAADYATVVPAVIPAGSLGWISPAAAAAAGGAGAAGAEAFARTAEAFAAGDAAAAARALADLEREVARAPGGARVLRASRLEAVYDRVRPFAIAMVSWAFGLVLLVLARGRPSARPAPAAALAIGLLVSAAALAWQAAVAGTPPLAAPGESLVLVGWLLAAGGLAAFAIGGRAWGLVGGLGAGLALTAAGRAASLAADEFAAVPAALRVDALLAAHVAAACLAYAAALAAAVLAHAWLLVFWRRPDDVVRLGRLQALLRPLLAAALPLLAVAMLLGALRADAVWGRLWGWDPKESGAVLLAVWIAVALQVGRIRRLPRQVEIAAAAATAFVLAVSWLSATAVPGAPHPAVPAAAGPWLAGLAVAEVALLAVTSLRLRPSPRPRDGDGGVWSGRRD